MKSSTRRLGHLYINTPADLTPEGFHEAINPSSRLHNSIMFLKTFAAFLLSAHLVAALPAGVKVENPHATDVVADKYIVILRSTLKDNEIEQHKSHILAIHSSSAAATSGRFTGIQYNYTMPSFKGYSGEFDSSTLQAISKSPEVKYIELVTKYNINTYTQRGAPWGLARVSHQAPGYSEYVYDDRTAGYGSTVYVVDTGVYTAHSEFAGRASWGANFADNSNTDLNGHGTHCAGTIAGQTYGVAKWANIVAVKVLGADGSGETSGIIAGMNWVSQYATAYRSVVSMSLGGGYSKSLNDAADALVYRGISVAVAAGNDGRDASNTSPASASSVITVGATDENDYKTSWSNYGPVVDIFAPGNNVLSAWIGSPYATNVDSGTSMATPHVAGLLAYFLSKSNGGMTPASARSQLLGWAGRNVISNVGWGSPNLLAYNGGGA